MQRSHLLSMGLMETESCFSLFHSLSSQLHQFLDLPSSLVMGPTLPTVYNLNSWKLDFDTQKSGVLKLKEEKYLCRCLKIAWLKECREVDTLIISIREQILKTFQVESENLTESFDSLILHENQSLRYKLNSIYHWFVKTFNKNAVFLIVTFNHHPHNVWVLFFFFFLPIYYYNISTSIFFLI